MFYKENRGFTLFEMIVVIIIIGILAAMALPQFGKAKEQAIGKEAKANLKLILAAEKMYRMEASDYYPVPASSQSDIGQINNYLKLSLPTGAGRNWDYTITSGTGTFSSTAQRQGISGKYSDCQYSINESQEEPVVAAGTCP